MRPQWVALTKRYLGKSAGESEPVQPSIPISACLRRTVERREARGIARPQAEHWAQSLI